MNHDAGLDLRISSHLLHDIIHPADSLSYRLTAEGTCFPSFPRMTTYFTSVCEIANASIMWYAYKYGTASQYERTVSPFP